MSQENVEIVRRCYDAGRRSLEAYWENPRSGAAALEAGEVVRLRDGLIVQMSVYRDRDEALEVVGLWE